MVIIKASDENYESLFSFDTNEFVEKRKKREKEKSDGQVSREKNAIVSLSSELRSELSRMGGISKSILEKTRRLILLNRRLGFVSDMERVDERSLRRLVGLLNELDRLKNISLPVR